MGTERPRSENNQQTTRYDGWKNSPESIGPKLSRSETLLKGYLGQKESIKESAVDTRAYIKAFATACAKRVDQKEMTDERYKEIAAVVMEKYKSVFDEGGRLDQFDQQVSDGVAAKLLTELFTYTINEQIVLKPTPGFEVKFQPTDVVTDIKDGIDAVLTIRHTETGKEVTLGIDTTTLDDGSKKLESKFDRVDWSLRRGSLHTQTVAQSPFSKVYAFEKKMPLIILGYSRDTFEQMATSWNLLRQEIKTNYPNLTDQEIDREAFGQMQMGPKIITALLSQIDNQADFLQYQSLKASKADAEKSHTKLQFIRKFIELGVEAPKIKNKKGAAITATPLPSRY